jgi:hypothetical protein
VIVRNQRALAVSAESFTRFIVPTPNGVVRAQAFFDQVVEVESQCSDSLLQGCVGEASGWATVWTEALKL